MLFVANGGIDTAVESGRVKRHLQQMDSSIVCLHPTTGELLGQWRLNELVQLPLDASKPAARAALGIGKLDNHWHHV